MKLAKNQDIKIMLKDKRITQRKLAESLKIRPETLSRCLKEDITPELRHRIFAAILTITRESNRIESDTKTGGM